MSLTMVVHWDKALPQEIKTI